MCSLRLLLFKEVIKAHFNPHQPCHTSTYLRGSPTEKATYTQETVFGVGRMGSQDTRIDTTLQNTKPMSTCVADTWRCFTESCCFYHPSVYASRYSATCLYRHRNRPNFCRCRQVPFQIVTILGRVNVFFLLQTGFRYSQVPFMTSFRV